MIANITYIFALIASFLWFAAGFRYFSFKHYASAKVMVPKSARTSPLFHTIAAATRFLGGFNGAFALLCVILLILTGLGSSLFTAPGERACLCSIPPDSSWLMMLYTSITTRTASTASKRLLR
jgi:hypothetical protein